MASWAFVGTHGDVVADPAQHDQISRVLSKEFEYSPAWPPMGNRDAKGRNGASNMWFFPVDNTQGLDDANLQRLLASVEQTLDKAAYVHTKVPLTWFKVLDMMHEHQRGGAADASSVSASFLSYAMIEKYCADQGVTDHRDVEVMLHFFHEMGVLMWHRESSLRDMVILNPIDYFVSPATMLICKHVQEGDDSTFHFLEEHDQAQRRHKFEWDKMIRDGVVHRCIVETVWAKYNSAHRLQLIELCKKYGLLVSLQSQEEEEEGDDIGEDDEDAMESHWFVPGILKDFQRAGTAAAVHHVHMVNALDTTNMSTFFFFFGISRMLEERNEAFYLEDAKVHGFLPSGLFERLIGKIVSWEHDKATSSHQVFTKVKAKNLIVFNLHQQLVRITLLEDDNMLEVGVGGKGLLAVHHRLKDMLTTLIDECLKELKFITLLSYPANQSVVRLREKAEQPEFMFLRLSDLQHAYGEKSSFMTRQFSKGITPKEMLETYSSWLEMLMRHDNYDFFLSHRWIERDKALANNAFEGLTLANTVEVGGDDPRSVRVFLDSCRLTAGRSFQEEFSFALMHTTVVVSVISYEVVKSMVDRSLEQEDNVLIEWMLALLCVNHPASLGSRVRRILPVMLGYVDPVSKLVRSIQSTGIVNELPEVHPSCSVSVLKTLLATHSVALNDEMEQQLANWTVKSVVTDMMKNLGVEDWTLLREEAHKRGKKKTAFVDLACKAAMQCLHESLQKEAMVADPSTSLVAKEQAVHTTVPPPSFSAAKPAKSQSHQPQVNTDSKSCDNQHRALATLTLDEVGSLLAQSGLKAYIEVFASNHVEGSVLAGNSDEDLLEALEIMQQKRLYMLWRKFAVLLQEWKAQGVVLDTAVVTPTVSDANRRVLKTLQAEELAALLAKHGFPEEYLMLQSENSLDGMVLDTTSDEMLTEVLLGDIQSQKKASIHWPRLLALVREWRERGVATY